MIKNRRNPKVDAFFSEANQWRKEMEKLRAIALDCGLAEELKWGKPCYAYEGGNVTIIQEFKAYCALLFFKGALLKDSHGILVKTGENTVVGRQIRFTSVREIIGREAVLKSYIHQAMEVEKAGLKVEVPKQPASVPEELLQKWDEFPDLKTAFDALTPGRQRAYFFYFSAPKQSKTRVARIEKCARQILQGRGLNDP